MRRQRGATLVLTALTLAALLGTAALGLDVAVLHSARQQWTPRQGRRIRRVLRPLPGAVEDGHI